MPIIPEYVCELPDNRIRFSLKKRDNSDCYFVCFRDVNNRRRELTTGERAKHKAIESALLVIRDNYTVISSRINWDDSIKLMLRTSASGEITFGHNTTIRISFSALRKTFPKTFGPADITPAMAERFKVKRSHLAPKTVEGNIKNCLIAYNWFVKRCKILKGNPFEDVTPPKYDKTPPRIVKNDEIKKLKDWLNKKWGRLPVLFLEVMATIGCRIGELSQATTNSLHDGRLYFLSETTKGRRQRVCKLPEAMYQEVRGIAGPVYIFNPNPRRFKRWLQDQVKEYFRSTKAKRFKLHSLRATAMTKAREAGIPVDDAAVAFGCNSATMKQYYLAPNEVDISDTVFDRLRGM